MTEVFDMNISDLFNEESEFIEHLQVALKDLGVKIDATSLATILHKYERVKMDFLKAHIMKLLEDRSGDFEDGPVKVVVSQSGIELESIDQESETVDTHLIS